MNIQINSPVLVPFGKNITVVDELIGKKIYIHPQYRFWGKNLETLINNVPTKYTMDYIIEKINEDYSGIIKRSKYFGLLSSVFNIDTAIFLDKLYQIELEQNHKDILVLLLTTEFEKNMDDLNRCKNIVFGTKELNYIFENQSDFIKRPNIKNTDIRFIEGELNSSQFGTIYDSIPREGRMYTPQYLGFVSLFSGKKEIPVIKWDEKLKHVADFNLIHDGFLILKEYPSEYKTKIKNILKDVGLKKFRKMNVWKKPDLTVKKISKGIKRYF